MALYQNDNREIRYLNNTEREQKVIGNYYRDIIRQYGVDVNYYKLKLPYMEQFKTIVDQNTVLLHAYGYSEEPDYSVSARMISYMEVQDDLLNLDKYGVVPNTTVNFWFDRDDFACALAQKLGQLKEYKVREREFDMEVPGLSDALLYRYDGESCSYDVPSGDVPSGDVYSYSLSDDIFPYALGQFVPEVFETEILTGRFAVVIPPYEMPEGADESPEYTVRCAVIDHGEVDIRIPTNEWTANSFKRRITNDSFVETMLLLTYRVRRIPVEGGRSRYVLHGRLHGGVLFSDTTLAGKYMDKIHPDVGDVVTIGFPSQGSRQQYEITECTDKRITSDGINPLLGKYVWLCKAKRRVDNQEGVPERNEDDERIREGMEFLNDADEVIARKIADYDDEETDAAYGGYERKLDGYDSRRVDYDKAPRLEFIDDGSWIELFQFQDGSQLVTDGYELYYVDSKGRCCKLTAVEDERVIAENLVASGIQYLKASDDALFFVNFDNRACRLCEDPDITGGEIQMCLNSLVDTTFDGPTQNERGQCYYKFRESKTVLMSLGDNLYCRLGNANRKIIKLT